MAELKIENLGYKTGQTALFEGANLTLQPGELITLLGPNGAGKTSLLRAAIGLQKPSSGSARLDGEDCQRISPLTRARALAYLPQQRPLAWPNRVRDIVALGRFAYGAAPGRLSRVDAEAVTEAMEQCDVLRLADRSADTLSGGELARVHCARAFAAKAPLLIADEPVAALDPRHQFKVMDLIRDYVANGGGALVVLHDIGLAARYATRMVWMAEGRIIADGTPEETLNEARLADIYGVRAKVTGRHVEIDGTL